MTELQYEMLSAGTFHIDGWTSTRGMEAAQELEQLGFVKSQRFVAGGQYTAINFTVTQKGRDALRLATQ